MLEKNLQEVQKNLKTAKLIAVTKTRSLTDIEQLYRFGQRDFGENRVEELLEKSESLKHLKDIRWHMIGHLQSKKISLLAKTPNLEAIHSLCTQSSVRELIKHQVKSKIFIQINPCLETQKKGFLDFESMQKFYLSIKDQLNVYGLMVMGVDGEVEQTRVGFAKTLEWRNKLNSNLKLSMGMSQDFHLALDFQSDFVRIGSALFVE
jgi:hypothetical protein